MAGSRRGDGAGARKARRRRVQGAALSGGALVAGQLAGAAPAHALPIVVNSLLDDGDGSNTTLREAIAASNFSTGVTDTITFSVAGTIHLTAGEILISDDVIINGPAPTPGAITVDADAASRIFYVYNNSVAIDVTISGLTLTDGNSTKGGAIAVQYGTLTLDDMVITANHAEQSGGGVSAFNATSVVINDSLISENSAPSGGGVWARSIPDLTITGTQFVHNTAFGDGGGLLVWELTEASISGATFDNNQAGDDGAGIYLYGADSNLSLTSSVLTSNDAGGDGGGVGIFSRAAGLDKVSDTTISGNTAAREGGGLSFHKEADYDGGLLIERSTISGNDGGEGGGVYLANNGGSESVNVVNPVTILDSTISGNDAVGIAEPNPLFGAGGGVFVNLDNGGDSYGGVDTLTVTLANSTIAGNSTTTLGGGVYEDVLNDAIITLDHTIVGDNSGGFGGDVFGSVNANWSLIENLAGVSFVGANNVPGVDPQLSPLANNGGPTFTQMIAPTSPAHNSGNPAFGAVPAVDQRGRRRISGTKIDIGAVERQTSLPAVVNSSVNWRLRDRLSTGPANLPTFSLGTTPLVPVMGDWDGDGDKTPGYYKGGVFTLSNNLDGSGPPVSFTF
ncbi:MAG: hypothetical protein QOG82_741, partial [Actinomycetota bacterium]|nr:hypothetical protein [Actinomycetota bacterium]